ncbi:Dihydroanticapsin 7-dehydrogenase [Calidithermus terrae]|uniref:Dihydroanticapsin 7-dehydrogenase n=2 Tax=Calidithermus TaxID=2747271 RepID=A0A399EKW8_9DEIN|nr:MULTISPECIES: SDR family oxidoreductase [Calidithermus]RIH84093.1 Dihydroanticapsin 7-dehydrogenase [Calidithermus roseus]RIH90707.1 Dihydroanticapsin 7-dehydrogenase [Calidithermus terrae]
MKGAIVTGGSGSIGAAVVRALASAAYRVHVLDKQPLPAALESLAGITAVDLRDPAACQAAVESACRELGSLETLVYCAGVLGPTCPLEAAPLEELYEVVAVNLAGAVACVHAAVPHLKASGGGSVVFVASISAEVGSSAAPVYGAAKAGLVGLAKGLARQLGRHRIRVNCVSPGSVASTRLLTNARGYPLTRAESLAISARLPLARLTSAEEVAQGVLYLCGPGGCSITGTNLVIDAGESLCTD